MGDVWSISLPVILLALLGYLIFNPEKAERIASWLYRLFAAMSQRAERGHVATDLQARINALSKTINKQTSGALPYKLKIDWVTITSPEAFLKDGKVVWRKAPISSF